MLRTEPLSAVTVAIASSDATEGSVDVSSLAFTAANWDVPQTVTVTDTHGPVLTGCPGDTTVDCASVPAAATRSEVRRGGTERTAECSSRWSRQG